MKSPMAPKYTTRIRQKKMGHSRRLWVKEPRHSETISPEKCYLYRTRRRFSNRYER